MLCNFVNGLLTTVNKSCQTCVIFFNVFYAKDCHLDNILSNHIHLFDAQVVSGAFIRKYSILILSLGLIASHCSRTLIYLCNLV